MRHLPSISSDFRQLPGLTADTRDRKTNKKRNTGVSVSPSISGIFVKEDFCKILVNEREGGNSGNLSTFTAYYSKMNQELHIQLYIYSLNIFNKNIF